MQQPKGGLMTTNERDANTLLLDQTYFGLDAKGFATFQESVDNPRAIA